MKRIVCLLLVIIMAVSILISCDDKSGTDENNNRTAPEMSELDMTELEDVDMAVATDDVTDHVIIHVEDYGRIVVRLFPEVAPKTVENFKKLVSQKFYDGLIFHRVIEGFMIQGGDPEGTGMGGSDEKIKGEFSSNGFKNNLKHLRGVISMARSNEPNSASSQFFICHKTSAHLDGSYASFGYVVAGMDVVDEIASVATNSSDKPRSDVVISSIRFANISDTPVHQPEYDIPEKEEDTSSAVKFEDIDLTSVEDIALFKASETESNYVMLDVADYGKIVIRLFPDVAPETVAKFKSLISSGYYNGLSFEKVRNGTKLQIGGGSETDTIKGEFNNNGFENNLLHKRGVVSMDRELTSFNSATSDFFICHKDCFHYNGGYAAFGYVVYGMDTVDEIASAETDNNDKPTTNITITTATFVTL